MSKVSGDGQDEPPSDYQTPDKDRLTAVLIQVDAALNAADLSSARRLLRDGRDLAAACADAADRRQMYSLLEVHHRRLRKIEDGKTKVGRRKARRSRAEALAHEQCVDCGQSGSTVRLTAKSGQPRCERCHSKWASTTCTRCGRRFNRKATQPRQRLCPKCRGDEGSKSVRTVSGGLPTLGKRR